MTTKLPMDVNDNPIPALRLKDNGAHTIATTITPARNTTPFTEQTHIVSLYADQDVYIKFGDANVTATSSDHFFPAGIYYDFAIGGDGTGHYTHISTLRATQDGTIYISEKE